MSQKDIKRYNVVNRLIVIFSTFSRKAKQKIVVAADVGFIIITVWISFSLRYETIYIPKLNEWVAYIAAILIYLPIFYKYGLYRFIIRYSGFAAISMLAKACLLYGVLYAIVISIIGQETIPRSVGILQPLLLLIAIGSSRAFARYWLHPGNMQITNSHIKDRYLIYGAGSAGVQIASAFQHNSYYSVDGFVDDDPTLHGTIVNGVTVYSNIEVPDIIKNKGITSIVIALPNVTKTRREEICKMFERLGVHIRILPRITDLANGKLSISDIREVDIEDLLGRDPVMPNSKLFSKCIIGKTVLVTGAGGSIGSELCRQIILQKPNTLILIERSEYNLYSLEDEILKNFPDREKIMLISLLGDVTDFHYMQDVCIKYKPDTIYHAAAYKHVPIVEKNITEGIRNNVFGTLSIAKAAQNNNVSHFILVSTDKAVRPTNVMGASKRIAELILQAMSGDEKNKNTCFSIVRFGNVLGSSGSVVPLFRKQIKNGGPLTVTHKEITRYFMTIPEAAQLVIQAGALAEGGDVFILDMGEPIKIIDLAKRMIELSGLTIKDQNNPQGDIEIVVTGLRIGEKLYEELIIGDNPIKTEHSRIFKAKEYFFPMKELEKYLDDLDRYIISQNIKEIKGLLKEIVFGYNDKGMEYQKER